MPMFFEIIKPLLTKCQYAKQDWNEPEDKEGIINMKHLVAKAIKPYKIKTLRKLLNHIECFFRLKRNLQNILW